MNNVWFQFYRIVKVAVYMDFNHIFVLEVFPTFDPNKI